MAEEQLEETTEKPTEDVAEETEEEAPEETEEQTEEQTEETGEEEPEEEEPTPQKRKQTAQERINELTRLRREKEREADYWKQVALNKKESAPEQPEQPQLPSRPKLENFETQEAYEDALFEWRDNVTDVKNRSVQAQTQAAQDLSEFNNRAKPLREQYEDFDETIESPVFTPLMKTVLLKSDNGPEVAYFLGKPENHETANRIGAMPPEMQIYELGKLEQNIVLTKKTKPKATRAPAPITPVGITGGSQTDTSKMNIDQWMKWDKQQTLEKIKNKFGGNK